MFTDNLWALLLIMFSSGFASSIVQLIFNKIDQKKGSQKKIDDLSNSFDEYKAQLARTHILRFNDDLHNDVYHSEEYFKQTLLDIDTYDRYCKDHPNFANGLTIMASQNIKDEFQARWIKSGVERKN